MKDMILKKKIKFISQSDLKNKKPNKPSTRDVKRVTFAAFLLPAGKFRPIFSSFSRSDLPPFFDLALGGERKEQGVRRVMSMLPIGCLTNKQVSGIHQGVSPKRQQDFIGGKH